MLIFLIFASNQVSHAQSQVTLSLDPSNVNVTDLSSTFTVDLDINGVTNLWGWAATVTWDQNHIAMVKAPQEGDFFSQAGHQTEFVSAYNKTTQSLKGAVADAGLDAIGVSGSGTLAIFTFQVTKAVLNSIIKVDVTNLYSNQSTGGSVPEFTNPISPYPAVTVLTSTVSCQLSNGQPIAYAGGNQTVKQFTNVILNASLTQPQSVPGQSYTWTFFDNASRTLQGMIANYTFFWPGVTVVTLTVTNANGTSTDIAGITVQDITPPVAAFAINGYSSGQSLPVNRMLVFNASQSYDPYNMTLRYSWNFGDASVLQTGEIAQHLYTGDGSYSVSLTVTNSARLKDTVNETVTVGSGVNPTTTPNPAGTGSPTGNPGQPTPNGAVNSQSFSLPSTVLWTIVFVTILVLVGSVFWLRKSVGTSAVLPG